MSKLRNNMMYQSVYQLLAIAIPLVTSPYLSRVIGATGLGIYSYNYSIVSYFMLFALLGVTSYGMRAIAQSEEEEVSKTFFSIYSFQLISSVASLLVYLVFVLIFVKEELMLIVSFIHLFYLLGECININWLFFGLEKYKATVLRNIFIKVITLVSIFLFVKEENDVTNYIFILAFGNFLSNAVLWLKIKDCVSKVKINWSDITRHIKPNIVLFIPALAASVYHIMDKTMLGMFSDAENSGYYYNADKLLNIPLTIVVACSNVFMTRISSLVARGDIKETKKTQNESIYFGMCVICAVAFGISAVAKEFVPWFFGEGFEACISLVKYFAMIVVVKTISTHTRSAFLIPEGNDSSYAKAVTLGGTINLFANYLLIAKMGMGALGATLATLLAEVIVVLAQLGFMKEKASKKHCVVGILRSMVYLVMGFVMFIIVEIIPLNIGNILLKLLAKVIVGGSIYVGECLIAWRLLPDIMPDMIAGFMKKLKVI